MGVFVDSCVLIDVLRNDVRHHPASLQTMRRLARTTNLYMNQVVAAEIRWVASKEHPLLRTLIKRLDLSWEAAELAGEAHQAYRERGGPRDAILADFLIGAHAATAGLDLLTRDPRRFRATYPTVRLIIPEQED